MRLEMTHLLRIVERLPGRVLVRLRVVDLQSSKSGIFKAYIQADYVVDDRVVFVRFQGRRDGEVRSRVSVQNIDKFRLLHSRDHDTTTLRVGGQVLSGYDSPRARLAIGLLVDLDEATRLGIIVKDDDSS